MTNTSRLRLLLKTLHDLAAIGVGGGLAACLVVNALASRSAGVDLVAARQAIAGIASWVLVPSLGAVLITGLLAIAVTRGFHDAGWAWAKAALGIGIFEATLMTVAASGRQAALAAAGDDPSLLASLLRSERITLWLLLALCVANVVLAVWRPRLTYRVR